MALSATAIHSFASQVNQAQDFAGAASIVRSFNLPAEDMNAVLNASNFNPTLASAPTSPLTTPSNSTGSGLNMNSIMQAPNTIGSTTAQAKSIFGGSSALTKAQQIAAQDHLKLLSDTNFVKANGDLWDANMTATYMDPEHGILAKDAADFARSSNNVEALNAQAVAKPSMFSKIQGLMKSPWVSGPMAGLSAAGLYFGVKSMMEHGASVGNVASSAFTFFSGMMGFHSLFVSLKIFSGTGLWMVSAGIMATMVVLAVLMSVLGTKDAPISDTGRGTTDMVSQLGDFANSIPPTAVNFIAMGALFLGAGQGLSPDTLYQSFSVPTVQLTDALHASATGSGSSGSRVLIQQGENGASDIVTVLSPNGATTRGFQFHVDKNGYVVGRKGPATSYLPIATPVVDAHGTPTGVRWNEGSLNALLEVPACTAIANDSSLDTNTRQAALSTCMRNNKDVRFVPMPQ